MTKENKWNPTLLTLLRQGNEIVFNDGYRLRGNVECNVITDCVVLSDRGPWSLDEKGLEKALKDIEKERAKSEREYQ